MVQRDPRNAYDPERVAGLMTSYDMHRGLTDAASHQLADFKATMSIVTGDLRDRFWGMTPAGEAMIPLIQNQITECDANLARVNLELDYVRTYVTVITSARVREAFAEVHVFTRGIEATRKALAAFFALLRANQ